MDRVRRMWSKMDRVRRMWSRQFDQYSSDDNYHWEIQLVRFAFCTTGSWPEAEKTNQMKFFISVIIMVVFRGLPQLARLFSVENESQLFICIGVIIRQYYSIGAIFFLRLNSKVRQYLLEEMRKNLGTDFSNENKKIMFRYALSSRIISLVIISGKAFATAVEFLNPVVEAVKRGDKFAILPDSPWYSFSSPNTFALVSYISDVIALSICVIIAIGIDVGLVVFMFHTCAQLIILGNRMKMYEGKVRHSSGEDILAECSCVKCIVDSHIRICEFVKKIDSYFHMIIFWRLSGSVIFVCSVGFEIAKAIMTSDYTGLMTNAIWTSYVFAVLFLYCWLAEMWQQRSDALGDIAYSSSWVMTDGKISRDFIFIIRHTRIPLKITAAKYYVLSMKLFKEFTLMATSYLSVLIAIMKLGK